MSSLVRRILLLALAGGVLVDVTVPGNAAGLNAPLVMAAFLASALVVAGRDGLRRMDPADAWIRPAALAFAGMAAVRADDWLVTCDLLFALALAAGTVGCLAGGRVTRGLVPHVTRAGRRGRAAAGRRAARAATVLLAARRAWRMPAARRRARPGSAGGCGRRPRCCAGLVIAVPVVARVRRSLFASADAVFARLASDLLAWRLDIDLSGLADRSLVVAVVAWGGAGLLALGGRAAARVRRRPRRVAATTAASGRPMPHLAIRIRAAGADPGTDAPRPTPRRAGSARPTRRRPGSVSRCGRCRPAAATWPDRGLVRRVAARPRPPMRLGSIEAATVLVVVDAAVRGLRRPPARLPVRWPRHARASPAHLCRVRAARVLRARLGGDPRRRSSSSPWTSRSRGGRGSSSAAPSSCWG